VFREREGGRGREGEGGGERDRDKCRARKKERRESVCMRESDRDMFDVCARNEGKTRGKMTIFPSYQSRN
jgi:hypothetical protein